MVPYAVAETNAQVRECFLRDERRLIDRLGDMDSESASIISFLNITREAVAEAMARLRDSRAQQVTLFTILSIARFRILTKSGLIPTMCPQPNCGKKDSFWHLLSCYGLISSVECGPHVAPFLVYIAQKAHTTCPPIPWCEREGEDKPTKERA